MLDEQEFSGAVMAPKIAITGSPGVGKSAFVHKVIADLQLSCYRRGNLDVSRGRLESELDSRSLICLQGLEAYLRLSKAERAKVGRQGVNLGRFGQHWNMRFE